MRTVIGLCGFAGSGKDEAAKALIEQRGFVKVSFAEPLRLAMAALNPIVSQRVELTHVTDIRYNDAIAEYGYDTAKQKFPEVRELLQKFGTEVGRQQFGEDFWIEQAKRSIDALPQSTPVVITDVRFPNEVRVVRDYKGVVVKLSRPGLTRPFEHVSENLDSLKEDLNLINRGTVEDLHRMIVQVADNFSLFDSTTIVDQNQPSLFEEDNSWAV